MKELKILSVLLLTCLTIGFTSCNKDDEELKTDDIVGVWKCTWAEGYEKYADNPEDNDEWSEARGLTATINADGIGVVAGDPCTWKLAGDKLTLTFNYGGDVSEELFTVSKLTSSEMILEALEKRDDYEYYEKITFSKVK